MKKFLFLSLFLLCTAMSAWSYTTETITLAYHGAETATDSKTGISVKAAPNSSLPCWIISSGNRLKLEVPYGYIITGVKFIFCSEEILQSFGITNSGSIKICDKLVRNGETWEQSDGAFSYNQLLTFSGSAAYVEAVVITYHKHEFTVFSFHRGVAATCTTPGTKEYWECSDCGHIYSES